eukprot:comp10397_c0_seq1/m.5176 comp10397_c0_seq1/g.5176  ORF comp10397_c0_seq1/g.5176 comp10397_c0_seq1/m.5176 type:complete len:178 (-) comp10397_c0_seq1:73-606(-)
MCVAKTHTGGLVQGHTASTHVHTHTEKMVAGRARGVSRGLAALTQNKVVLGGKVQRVAVVVSTEAKEGQGSTRRFLYEMVPPLQYHNPHVIFDYQKRKDAAVVPGLEVTFVDGRNLSLPSEGRDVEGILQRLVDATQLEDQRTAKKKPEWLSKRTNNNVRVLMQDLAKTRAQEQQEA